MFDEMKDGFVGINNILDLGVAFVGELFKMVMPAVGYILLVGLTLQTCWLFTVHNEGMFEVVEKEFVSSSGNNVRKCSYTFQNAEGLTVSGVYEKKEFDGDWLKVGEKVRLSSYVDEESGERVYCKTAPMPSRIIFTLHLGMLVYFLLFVYEAYKYYFNKAKFIGNSQISVGILILIGVMLVVFVCMVYTMYLEHFNCISTL